MQPRRIAAIAVIAGLGLVQLRAFSTQIAQGFRPFGEPPDRVSYSWDMFSVRIERCGVEFRPPVDLGGGKTLRRLKDLTPALEWDIAYNSVDDYAAGAKQFCDENGHNGTAHLDCVVPRNQRIIRDIDC